MENASIVFATWGELRPLPRLFKPGVKHMVLSSPRHVTAINSLLLETQAINTKNKRRSKRGGNALQLPSKKSYFFGFKE